LEGCRLGTLGIHDNYINPAFEKIEDYLNKEDLFKEIAASYSLTQEEIPDDDLDPIVPIRPA
jgi:hypothetical protein